MSAIREGTSIETQHPSKGCSESICILCLIANQAFDIFYHTKYNVLYHNQHFAVRKYKIDICENHDIMDILGTFMDMPLFVYV